MNRTHQICTYPLITFCMMLSNFFVSAQETSLGVEEILYESAQQLNKFPIVSIDLTYTLYKNPSSPKVLETYTGFFSKKHKDTYLKIDRTEFLWAQGNYLKINHEQQAMEYMSNVEGNLQANLLQMEQYLAFFSSKEVFSEGNYWRCVLKAPAFTQLPYGTITLWVDKITLLPQRQVFELLNLHRVEDREGGYTNEIMYLEIQLDGFKEQVSEEARFALNEFIQGQQQSKTLTKKYQKYRLVNRSVK